MWYPILHANITGQFMHAVVNSFPDSPDSCLALLILAIGSLVSYESISQAIRDRPDAAYIEAASAMVSTVLLDNSITSVQCLILFSIYFACLMRPCHSHDFIVMASSKVQSILKRYLLLPIATIYEPVDEYPAVGYMRTAPKNCLWPEFVTGLPCSLKG